MNLKDSENISLAIKICIAACLLSIVTIASFGSSTDNAQATVIGGFGQVRYGVSQVKGFDTCTAPSTATMQSWWTHSPYYDTIIYMGGIQRGCAQPNLNSSWAETVHSQGWGYYLTWVGPQAPCTGFQYRINSDPVTAWNQGQQEASAAMSAAISLGFTGINVYYYDMEYFDIGDAGCNWAVKNFVNGWVYWIRVVRGQKAGMYSTSCAVSQWTGVHIGYPPDSVWAATGNGDPDVWGLPCLWDGDWCCEQRLHQYALGVWENYGGLLFIDRDCADGPVTPHGHGVSNNACTVE